MSLKKSIFLLVLLLLLIPIIYAAEEDFTVTFDAINNKITADEVASFNLTIQNNLETVEIFRVFTSEYPAWDIYTQPIQNPILLEVGPESTKTTILLVDPLKVINIGAYDVNIKAESKSSGSVVITPVRVAILSSEASEYIPTVIADIEFEENIDPRDKIPIKIHLNNQNILDIKNLVIKIESHVINEEIEHELGPKERKTVEITKQIDPLTAPQEDVLVLTLLRGEEIITGPITKPYSIIEYAAILDEEKITKNFLKTEKEIEFNSNNENYMGIMEIEISPFKSLFTTTKPKATSIKKNGKKYLTWPVSLEDKLMTVKITENYRSLFYIAIVLIILVLIYFRFRAPLVIQKTITNIEKKEGGISNLNVILTVKNRGKAQLKDVELIDKIPNLADIEKEVSIGTLQPVKVLRHEKKGTIVKWILDNVDASEERVVRYRMKSKLSILGGFNLPNAVAKFRHNKKETISKSNRVQITSQA